ncbi:hypothetical protein ECC1470_03409 [Escherichia coli ECC-1470]|nr:hypothetical protein ECC1470_03409 [Escherichia coli ECC-1470]
MVFFIFIRYKIYIMRKIQNIKPFFVKIKFEKNRKNNKLFYINLLKLIKNINSYYQR